MPPFSALCLWCLFVLLLVVVGAAPEGLANKQWSYFRVRMAYGGQNFVVAASDKHLIAEARAELKQNNQSSHRLVVGKLAFGNGCFNNCTGEGRAKGKGQCKGLSQNDSMAYSWHLLPDAWKLSDMATEVCDGQPDFVEESLDYWVCTVKTYCPWSGYLVQELTPGATWGLPSQPCSPLHPDCPPS
ncbi:hypothetical protein QOT17_003454 [Balamuthia mandrillaris]